MKKLYNIELVRFLLSILIVYYHITHSSIMPHVGDHEIYLALQSSSAMACAIVECFLVLGGFFTYASFERNPEKSFFDFFLDKVLRLWPVLACFTLLCVLYGATTFENALFDLFFLRGTGISLNSKGIIWYIGPYFLATLFAFAVLRYCRQGIAAMILALTAYWGYAINVNSLSGGLGRDVIHIFLSMAMLKSLAGISLGCLISMGISAFRAYQGNGVPSPGERIVKTCLTTLLELGSLGLLAVIFVTGKFKPDNTLTVVILFGIYLICAVSQAGLFSRLTNLPIFGILGRYAYSIYVMQQISFYILRDTFWLNSQFLNDHIKLTMAISIAVTVAVGVITYHLVEAPAVSRFRRWKNKRIPS